MKKIIGLALVVSSTLIACVDPSEDPSEEPDDFTGDVAELDVAPAGDKEDGAGIKGLPVRGDYGDTRGWMVTANWEDRTTPAARKAGMAWPADSGLSWDEKFSRWVGSLEIVPADTSSYYKTIRITTPWGKTLPSPKLDCADAALLLRASFAAWYNLPFTFAAGGNPTVYFGHFGPRTKNGRWSESVKIGELYKDFSATPPANLDNWPRDSRLRKMHVHGKLGDVYQDEMPYLFPNTHEGTGAYLDELHLNKKAARMIMYLLAYTGSIHLADTNNTFNLQPNALRAGDTLLYRRAPNGTGHTMIMVRVDNLPDGKKEAQDVFGNEPPAQLYVESPAATRGNLMRNEGGGEGLSQDGMTPYAKIGGGLKRWRVAKAIDGVWRNTWMDGDEANWIDSTDLAKIAARPKQFGNLMGALSPERLREELVAQINLKREHLRNNPSSCSARTSREELFDRLVQHNQTYFGKTAAQTEREFRDIEDYVYAPLQYTKSRTCCWNSSSRQMHETIMKYVASLQANGCVQPPPFMQTGGTFGAYQQFAATSGLPFGTWRADEECASDSVDDAADVAAAPVINWCANP